MDTPLNDEECQIRISELIVRIENAAEEMAKNIDKEAENEAQLYTYEVKKKMQEYDAYIEKRKSKCVTDENLFLSRIQNTKRIKQLIERDKLILNVVLAIHNRLGNVDHKAHRKAYRRILFSLVLQGLCRQLVEAEVKVRFRKSDLRIGISVLKQASEQFEKMSGISVNIHTDTMKFLPLESCGGVDMYNMRETVYVRNALSVRLDRALYMANPLIRFLLFGRNPNRRYYDLSFVNYIKKVHLSKKLLTVEDELLRKTEQKQNVLEPNIICKVRFENE